jgi:hypothetical protein
MVSRQTERQPLGFTLKTKRPSLLNACYCQLMTFIAVCRACYNLGFKLLRQYLVRESCCVCTRSKIFAETKCYVHECLTTERAKQFSRTQCDGRYAVV